MSLLSTMRLSLWVSLVLLSLTFQSTAQSVKFKCGTELLSESIPSSARQAARSQLDDDPSKVYMIPVVFVVYHLGEPVGQGSNVSDALIKAQLDLLNDRFAGKGLSGYSGQDTKIRFTLAKSTPDCQQSTGLYRVDGRSVPNYETDGVGFFDGRLAQLARLLPADFTKTSARDGVIIINIVHLVNGAQAFATYGGMATLGFYNFTATQEDNYVLSHEIGHVLSLRHIFEGSEQGPDGNYQCPPNANPLTDGDMVADTDPIRYADLPPNGCAPGYENYINPCSGLPFGKLPNNLMHYGCRQDRFTPGQVAKMRTYLANELSSMADSQYLYPVNPNEVVAPLNCTLTQIQPPPSSFTVIGINTVQFQDINRRSTAYPAGQYTNNTCIAKTQVVAGQSYPLVVKGYGTYGRAYLDYNNDGTFDESSELIMAFRSTDRDQQYDASQSVTIPLTAVRNQRLRLRVIFDSGTTPPTACNLPGDPAVGSGEVEDYGVTIVGPRCISVKQGSWNDTSVWSCGHSPTALDDVVIQAEHSILLDSGMSAAVCQSLEVLGTFSMQGIAITVNGVQIVIDQENVITK